jgi:hypothetical protein
MRDLLILFVHLIGIVVRLAKPGGLRSVVAESVLIRHQLLILNRGRKRDDEGVELDVRPTYDRVVISGEEVADYAQLADVDDALSVSRSCFAQKGSVELVRREPRHSAL